MKIKRNIAFKLRVYGKDQDLFQIRLRTTFNSQRIDLKTGCQINSRDAWDEKEQLVKDWYVGPKKETARAINNELRNVKDQMDTAFKFFEAMDQIPTAKQVKEKYEERLKGTVPQKPAETPLSPHEQGEKAFWDCFSEFLTEDGEKNAWTPATYGKMNALMADLKAFKRGISFKDITEPWLTSFVVYLRDAKTLHTPRKKKGDRRDYDHEDIIGIKNSTIDKKLGYLRWFLNWATEKGYNTNKAYRSFHPTLKQTQRKVIYLTKDELSRLCVLPLTGSNAYLEQVRDAFLFCCFSGLRHSDANNLRRSDIKDGYFEVTTVKTADSITIELNEVTKAILKKYESIPFPGDKALPNLTNQAMNRDVKKLCKLAGIDEEIRITTYKGSTRHDEVFHKWEKVGTHTGRRTFIVNALSLGIPPSVVMKWTGHSDYNAMKPYIDIVDSIKAESMTKFNDLL